nr:MAG TPA: YjcQ protein [Caudoviricetes sp.]
MTLKTINIFFTSQSCVLTRLFFLIWLHVYLLSVSRSLLLLHVIIKTREMMKIMKRDLDLLRKMLLRIEELDSTKSKITINSFSDLCDYPPLISLHIELLIDDGFIETSEPIYCGSISDYWIYRLTSSGYDYLDAIRNPSIWQSTLNKIESVGGSVTLDIVKSIAVSIIKSHLGI